MILDDIVANKKSEIAGSKRRITLAEMERRAKAKPRPLDFASALSGDGLKLIAEVKKASPSKGIIREDFNVIEIAKIYADNGASAISVLTDEKYFQGKLKYLLHIKKTLIGQRIPLLRKDFIIDPYQVYESRAYGADAILLIAAILSQDKLERLLSLSHKLGMACLVEIHNVFDLIRVELTDARIIGINNRDLRTMVVNLDTTDFLRSFIHTGRLIVSESGIKTHGDIKRLEELGINAVLVGESLMASPDIAGKMKELLG